MANNPMQWQQPVSPPGSIDGVFVWRADTASFLPELCHALLSAEEQARAARFRHAQSKQEYIVGHACLRFLLGQLTNQSPQALQFQATNYGKPYLHGLPIAFNITHSAGIVLIAIAAASTIGVDLEHHKPHFNNSSLHREIFTSSECSALQDAASPQQQEDIFFHLWTCKEALLKADGRGLMLPSASFAITLQPQQTVHLPGQATPLFVQRIPFDEGYSAAIACDIIGPAVALQHFPPVWLQREGAGATIIESQNTYAR